jgi:hypothetical protein
LPLSSVSFSCRLPVYVQTGYEGSSDFSRQDGFISFPSASLAIDPSGHGGGYFDRAFARWLPVTREAVSPDGTRYTFLEPKVPGTPGRQRLHVVDVSTGTEKVVELGQPGDTSAYVIVNFATEGVWLSYAGYEAPRGGLLMLDLNSGALMNPGVPGMVEQPSGGFGRSGDTLIEPVAGGPGVFWFSDGGPNPQSAAIGFTIPARVQRLTMPGGKTVSWFTKQDAWVSVLGADLTEHPIIATSAVDGDINSKTIWLASSPTAAHAIGLPPGDYRLIADSHGVWFGSRKGIYLYSDAGGLQKVSNQPGYPANGCF